MLNLQNLIKRIESLNALFDYLFKFLNLIKRIERGHTFQNPYPSHGSGIS